MAVRKTRREALDSVWGERGGSARTGTVYERNILRNSVKSPGKRERPGLSGSSTAARVRSGRDMTYETALAIQAAKEGDDTELLPYQPTPSINPPRPRTLAAGYDPDSHVMRIRFRDGTIYGYADVTPTEWRNFKRVKSPGRAVNRTFNHKEYWREPWS